MSLILVAVDAGTEGAGEEGGWCVASIDSLRLAVLPIPGDAFLFKGITSLPAAAATAAAAAAGLLGTVSSAAAVLLLLLLQLPSLRGDWAEVSDCPWDSHGHTGSTSVSIDGNPAELGFRPVKLGTGDLTLFERGLPQAASGGDTDSHGQMSASVAAGFGDVTVPPPRCRPPSNSGRPIPIPLLCDVHFGPIITQVIYRLCRRKGCFF